VQALTESNTLTSEEIARRLEQMDNKLERIKSSVHNLNRVASLVDAPVIVSNIKEAIGGLPVRAAILLLTKEKVSRKELVQLLGIYDNNLNRYMNAFLDNREYVNQISESNKVFYQRVELIDLVGLERDPEFIALVETWRVKRQDSQNVEEKESKPK
jgi:hypothetical protein